ncbi:hypothetical protein [Billgrantia sulfidoxydans]|uniref:hypothetical protein n=1 Tax=Billgrantia sulfidoxydans TaxID=2733484 RepID=UPI001F5EE842|nr:hypothetical protein [Halomonas sulfidoxydans]
MIAYTMVGTRSLERALKFYDPLFAEMGWDVCWKDDSCISYGKENDLDFPRFFVGYPFDGQEAGVGNGTMTAFQFAEPEQVDSYTESPSSTAAAMKALQATGLSMAKVLCGLCS